MAMTGTIDGTNVAPNLKLKLYWKVDNINNDTGAATLYYKLYIDGSNTVWYLGYGTNNFNLNNTNIYKRTSFGNGDYNNKLILYGRQADNGKTTTVKEGETWYGIPVGKWYTVVSTLAESSMSIQFDEEGYVSIPASGTITSSGGAGSINTTITPDRIDRFKKSRRTSDRGSSWSQDKYFWKTTDGGVTWKKCNAYKTSNGTASSPTWTKIS